MEQEVWTDIPEWEGYYQINNFAQIRSLDRYVKHRNGHKALKKGKLLKSCLNKDGYYSVELKMGNRKRNNFGIHRLVALTFIPKVPGKNIINHKNGIRTDNRIENLEWCNHSENALHAFKYLGVKGSATGKFGKDNPGSKPVYYILDSQTKIKYDSVTDAANRLNLSVASIGRVCNGHRKSYRGKKFIWA